MVGARRRSTVLSSDEQRIWDDIERCYAAEADEPDLPGVHPLRRRDDRDVDDPPAAVVAGAWLGVFLVLFGAVVAGLAVVVATGLGWLLWHHWPRLRGWVRRGRAPDVRPVPGRGGLSGPAAGR
jgi:hypothetical protein